MQKAIGQEDLKKMIKESIREVLREERLSLCEIMIPRISKKEMQEIQTAYGSPTRYREDDFVDVTDWVKA
jgi:glutaredoxin 2